MKNFATSLYRILFVTALLAINTSGAIAQEGGSTVYLPFVQGQALTPPVFNPTSSNASGLITLTWQPVTNPVDRYEIDQLNSLVWYTVCSSTSTTCQLQMERPGDFSFRGRTISGGEASPYSEIFTVNVPLPATPVLNPINNSADPANYTIEWSAVTSATQYFLYERNLLIPGDYWYPGSWDLIYQGPDTHFAITQHAIGFFGYYVSAASLIGISDHSNTERVSVPGAKPVLSAPQDQHNGYFYFIWTGVPGATAYTLEQNRQDGKGFQPVYTGPGTTWTSYDTVTYNGSSITYRVWATVNGVATDYSNTQDVRIDYGFPNSGVVSNHSTYKDPTPGSNIRYVVGEVLTSNPSRLIAVTATFYNGTTQVGTAANYAYAMVTDPYGMAPFKIVADDPGVYTSYTLSFSSQNYYIPAPRWTVLSQNLSVNGSGMLTVSGQVRNDSPFTNITSSNSIVVGTLYDTNGNIINVQYVDLVPSSVKWHEVRDYTLTFNYPLANSVAYVRVQAFGEPPVPGSASQR